MNTRYAWILASALGVLAATTTDVSADDNDGYYPATFCEPHHYSPGEAVYGEEGRVYNQKVYNEVGSQGLKLICPIQSRDAGASGTVRAQVRDNSELGSASCGVYRHAFNTNSRTWYNMGGTDANHSETTFLSLSLDNVPLGFTNASFPVSVYMVCNLPPHDTGGAGTIGSWSALASYSVID